MTKFLTMFLVFFGFFLSFATEALPVKDPNGLLNTVDRFLGNPHFEQSFVSGDWADFKDRQCDYNCDEKGFCEETCSDWEYSKLSVEYADNQHAIIGNHAEEDKLILTKDLYAQYNGNLLRLWLNESLLDAKELQISLPSLNQDESFLSVESLGYKTTELENGLSIESAELGMLLHFWSDDLEEFILFPLTSTVGKDIPGIAQLLHLGFSQNSGAHLIDFSRGQSSLAALLLFPQLVL